MKILSAALDAHFGAEETTLATCWHVTLTDGTDLCFSDHDEDITYQGFTYAAGSGVSPTTISNNSDMSVSNSEIMGFIKTQVGLGEVISKEVNEADIVGGRFDAAAVRIFVVNYEDLSMGHMLIQTGTLGELKVENAEKWNAEIRGPEQALATQIGKLYSITCRAELGDLLCQVNLDSFTQQGTVQIVGSDVRTSFFAPIAVADGYFTHGLLTWLTGKNAGLVMEVGSYVNGNFSMYLPMLHKIEAGDTFKVIKGCSKTDLSCIEFANILNFQGEPDIPGTVELMKDATKSGSVLKEVFDRFNGKSDQGN